MIWERRLLHGVVIGLVVASVLLKGGANEPSGVQVSFLQQSNPPSRGYQEPVLSLLWWPRVAERVPTPEDISTEKAEPTRTDLDTIKAEATPETEPEPITYQSATPLTWEEIYYLASQYDWPAEKAACLSWEETGETGDPSLVSDTDDWGLWQLNRPTWEPHFGWERWSRVLEPETNVAMAYEVYVRWGRTFGAWSTDDGRC